MADNSPQGYMTLLAQNPEMMIEYLQKQVDELNRRYQVLLEAHQRALSFEKADTVAVHALKEKNRQLLHIIFEVIKGNLSAANGVLNETTLKKKTPIKAGDFSTRVYNVLRTYRITTLEELSKVSLSELSGLPNIGKRSVMEILALLNKHGLSLADGEQ